MVDKCKKGSGKVNVPMTLSNGKSIELNNITESGSNYIRFSDGTQICYRVVSIQTDDKITHDVDFTVYTLYPKPFISTPALNVLRQQVNSDMSQLNTNIKVIDAISTVNGASVRFVSSADFAKIYVDFSYIAIGRWK